ncbi:MAG TPA: hypothetical protein VLV83_18750 [Acidobacteriota bacterium]|nr:hypothetical protein [Acidobacteriota bacterium]
MAFDRSDLHNSIEETFQIWLDEREANQAVTLDDLHQVVYRASQSVRLHCFFRLRQGLMDLTGIPRHHLDISSPLESLLPEKGRRLVWGTLSRRLGGHLPNLARPQWLGGMLRSFAVLALAALGSWLLGLMPGGRALGLAIGFSMVLTAGYLLTKPLARDLPEDCRTVGALGQTALRLNFRILARNRPRLSESEVWEALKKLISDQFGIHPERLTGSFPLSRLAA